MNVDIIGWSHSRFGRMDALTLEEMMRATALDAIGDAGLEPADIDAVFVGHFNAGFQDQGFTASLATLIHPDLRHTPTTRLENACATGSAAIHAGADRLMAGRGRHVLVVGVEKMTHLSSAEAGAILKKAAYLPTEGDLPGGFVGMFGEIAKAYFDRHGDKGAALARIAAKNHLNGTHNPFAQMRKDLGFDFCNTVSDKNPIVIAPLRRTDCSLVSDGAAALVLATGDAARSASRKVRLRARAQAADPFPMKDRDMSRFAGAERAWAQVLAEAGLALDDLDLVETHDCFTIAELIQYEAMGLTPPGQGERALEEGWVYPGGRLPVNMSGGLKSKGHPIGATGVSMHVVAAMQLAGEAGGMQVPGARLAAVFNMGGAAVANYATVLERV
ncbi:MAG: acetyl-CoA acetyltransferase [Rhodobacterales bacterium]|nr:acetyl-CoA acetyltransferase [Rhodobacterales bacterium]